jgi:hypothetical protein
LITESIDSQFANVSFLFFEVVGYLELGPHKVSFIANLINYLPPKPSTHDSFNDSGVIAKTNEKFQGFIILLSGLDIETIGEVNSKDEIAVAVESVSGGGFCYFTSSL